MPRKAFRSWIKKDLELVWYILDLFYRNDRLDDIMRSIISKNPLQDIVLILIPFLCIGFVDIGIEHFWITNINFLFAFGRLSLMVETFILY